MSETSTTGQHLYPVPESVGKMDNSTLWKGLDKITSSINHIGDNFERACEVAMTTATKAKLLLRELKTVKADLAYEKQRCSQLEEENKILYEGCQKVDNPADDDLIRLQLETLLAEKARLAHENSLYACENRFLREIAEYRKLTMQGVVYLNEGNEEVSEIYPITKMLSISPPSPMSPTSPSEISTSAVFPILNLPQEMQVVPNKSNAPQNAGTVNLKEEDKKSVLVSEEEDKSSAQVLQENAKIDHLCRPGVPQNQKKFCVILVPGFAILSFFYI